MGPVTTKKDKFMSGKYIQAVIDGLSEALKCPCNNCQICKDWIESAISLLEERLE